MSYARVTYLDGTIAILAPPIAAGLAWEIINDVFAGKIKQIEPSLETPDEPPVVIPDPRLEATAYVIGPGIRAAMARWGDSPAMDELPLRWLDQVVFAICLSAKGRLFAWEKKTDTVHVVGG